MSWSVPRFTLFALFDLNSVACADVVKKPKLDQHRARCHSGFDCIDCSTTFNTPADYKGHTQCISEAEKYQKSVYKGPKGVRHCVLSMKSNLMSCPDPKPSAPRNNYPPRPVEPAPPPGGRGGYFGGGYGRMRSSATGANDTPLGTPTRNSPVSPPAPVSKAPVPKTPVVQVKKPTVQAVETPMSSPEKTKKDKKRKSVSGEGDTVGTEIPAN